MDSSNAYYVTQQDVPKEEKDIVMPNMTFQFTVPTFIEPEQMNCLIPPTEEMGGLYLGNLQAAMNIELLKQNKIRAVLTTSAETGVKYAEEVIHFHECVPAQDREVYDISQHFDQCIEFIERHRKYTSILVHCYAGVSRSASVCIAYFMKKFQWPLEKALWYIKQKRRLVFPNPGFIKKLLEYEKTLFGTCQQTQIVKRQNKEQIVLPSPQPIVQQQVPAVQHVSIQQQLLHQQQQQQQSQGTNQQIPYQGVPPQTQQQQQNYVMPTKNAVQQREYSQENSQHYQQQQQQLQQQKDLSNTQQPQQSVHLQQTLRDQQQHQPQLQYQRQIQQQQQCPKENIKSYHEKPQKNHQNSRFVEVDNYVKAKGDHHYYQQQAPQYGGQYQQPVPPQIGSIEKNEYGLGKPKQLYAKTQQQNNQMFNASQGRPSVNAQYSHNPLQPINYANYQQNQ